MKLMAQAISNELIQSAKSYIQFNIDFLQSDKPDNPYWVNVKAENLKHIVVFAANEHQEIIGFRYFFFDSTSSLCNLFATFVDSNYRKQGIATQLISESFAIATSYGYNEFQVVLSQPTNEVNAREKNALFNWYCRFAESHKNKYKLVINFENQSRRYGYG